MKTCTTSARGHRWPAAGRRGSGEAAVERAATAAASTIPRVARAPMDGVLLPER
jgi:hypothetical protein